MLLSTLSYGSSYVFQSKGFVFMHYDLLIRSAHILRQNEPVDLVDIAIHEGRFVRISASAGELDSTSASREIDAGGRLVIPPFVDSHVHMDAVLTVGEPRF